MARDDLEFRGLTPGRFADVVDLFGTRGDPSWCWCQYFVTTGETYRHSSDGNRAALERQAARRPPPGLLAYAGGTPVGWVQVGPRTAYPRLCGNRGLLAVTGEDIADPDVWAVTCFVVRVGQRRKGVGAALLEAAVGSAREAGAWAIEGHPVDVAARPGQRVASAGLYHGAASTFVAAGFTEVGRTSPHRPVMRLELR
jgi:GNAT superfamily N-acetyltransferase